MPDLSPLLKVSARLLDLHDSGRTPGGSTQYQIEDRPGLGDGRYLSIAGEVLVTLQASGKQSGDEFSSVDFVGQSVRGVLTWANDLDVEYVLNVLSRPTELKLLQHDDDASSHVIGDKETNLVEKAAHLMGFRLSRLGRKALAMANDSTDLLYIEGDVTKLLRALETGRLKQAMAFLERLLDQLRTEHLALVSIIEKMAGGKRAPTQVFDDLEGFEATMRRTAELVNKAQGQVSVLARGDAQSAVEDDVPFGLVKDRVEELRRGIVGYARALSDLASKSMAVRSTSVQAPAFAKLALQLVTQPPTSLQTDFILSALGPVFPLGTVPMGTDLRGSIKVKTAKVSQTLDVVLGDFVPPPEDRFIEWMRKHQDAFNERLGQGRLTLPEAIELWAKEEGGEHDFGCLVAALSAPDDWLTLEGIAGFIEPQLVISSLPGAAVMHSYLALEIVKNSALGEEARNDTV
ncbi:hypothetical protein HUU62_22320 [Rhodoferax sp. 4810]|nr:hypothetical protein [Rhodoferax jenense]